MKTKKRNIWVVVAVVIGALFVLGLFKDQVLKFAVAKGTSQVTGAPVRIDSFSLGILNQSVRIKGFKLYNPKGFPDGVLLEFSEISVKCDIPALLKGKLHIPAITVNMKEMTVIKNEEGQLNVDSLKFVQKAEEMKKPAEDKGEKAPAKEIAMQIDKLFLNVGRVIYKDYSQGTEPVVQVFDVGISNKTYEDITSAQQLAALLTASALKSTAIKSAGVYGAAAILGVGFLPAGVAGALIGKDHAGGTFKHSYNDVYGAAIKALQAAGQVTSENKEDGLIKANVDGADVAVKLTEVGRREIQVNVSARKLLIPRPETAAGILYQIEQKLK
jgi:uncharacterized protein involved in outer membrane biogenesis